MKYEDRTSAKMASALSMVANGATPKAASEAAGVTMTALYRAMQRHGIGPPRCPTCGRIDKRKKEPDGVMDVWCSCGNPSEQVNHDHGPPDSYTCNDCGKLLQVG